MNSKFLEKIITIILIFMLITITIIFIDYIVNDENIKSVKVKEDISYITSERIYYNYHKNEINTDKYPLGVFT